MAITFKLNPTSQAQLQAAIDGKLELVALKLAEKCRQVIETERFVQGWTTSDPVRDIVDTGELDNSMQVERVSPLLYRITWSTPYVVYVYMGYTTTRGNRIPGRPWVQWAIDENNWDALLAEIFSK